MKLDLMISPRYHQTFIARQILRNLGAKFTHNLWAAIFKFKLPFAI
ncbi:hypothetical protein CAMGR0001_0218 [Campylobacter gracilis RM3268]|uniref:Uncharacterized protein n=1 Tax=Campylobacter gracilis RM3268 TaxID=553220 RepID=C8PKJ6_9BACT|nr:hypothetical protein CAMGR0001_0218 [Campylobacter gracilis RM3268]